MALPAGRYGVTKNQLLKIKKLPMNTIKLIEEIREELDTFGTAVTHDSTSVVTQSTDLVESGAVYDALGFGNKNLLPITLQILKKVNTSGTWSGNVYTIGNATFTISTDRGGSVTKIEVNGSAASTTNFFLSDDLSIAKSLKLKGCPSGGGELSYKLLATNTSGWSLSLPEDYGSGADLGIISSAFRIQLRLYSGAGTVSNLAFYPMLYYSTITDATYEPYHASVSDSLAEKVDNSVIAPTENSTTVQKSGGYAVGTHAIRNGAFITWKNAKAQGETINDASDYTSGDVAEALKYSEGDITPYTGFNVISSTKMIHKEGRVVNVSCEIRGSLEAATATTVATIPTEFRPNATVHGVIEINDGEQIGSVYISTSGYVVFKCSSAVNDKYMGFNLTYINA